MVGYYKENPKTRKILLKMPDFANYIIVEHPEKAKLITESAESEKISRKFYEEFIAEKYLKQNQI